MAIGDGSRKFGFSRMGMGLEEQREAESRQRGLEANARSFRATERMGRRAYRDLARRGDTEGAFEMMQNMAKSGYSIVGNYQAGEVERMNTDRLGRKLNNLTAGAAGNPATPRLDSNPQRKEWDKDGSGVPDMLQRDKVGPYGQTVTPLASSPAGAVAGPLASKMSFTDQERAKRDAYNAQNGIEAPQQSTLNPRQQFAADLMRSDLIQSGDPAAMAKAYQRGEGLGLGKDQIRGYLDKKIMENPYEIGADAGLGLSKTMQQDRDLEASASQLNKPAKPPNPLFEAAMARVSAAGGAARDADIAGIERVGNLQAEMEAARQKTDARFSGAPLTGIADAERAMAQHGVAQAFRERGLAIQSSERAQDRKLWDEQMSRKQGISNQIGINQFAAMEMNANRGVLGRALFGYADVSADTKEADQRIHGFRGLFANTSGKELKKLLDSTKMTEASDDAYSDILGRTRGTVGGALNKTRRDLKQLDAVGVGAVAKKVRGAGSEIASLPKKAKSLLDRILDYPSFR